MRTYELMVIFDPEIDDRNTGPVLEKFLTVVTKDGRLLAFSVILDGFESGGLGSARVAMDQDLIGPLADCGCRG